MFHVGRTSHLVRLLSDQLMICRHASSNPVKGETIMNVFDRKSKRIQRDRTALLPDYKVYEYVKEEFGFRLADRVFDIKRQFDILVDLGCGRGYVSKHLLKESVNTIYQCEMSEKMLFLIYSAEFQTVDSSRDLGLLCNHLHFIQAQSEVSSEVPTIKIVADEEFLPFAESSVDIVASSLSLHWVNDLPGCFRQIFHSLKPDGVFLGCMFAKDTLYELRVSLQLAETEREGGFAPHVSPFTDVTDLGNLLSRAGYNMITLDLDEMVVTYPTIYELMYDLKGMGENNCSWSRKPMLHRETIKAAGALYKQMYGVDDGIPATYQVIYFIGWKPHPSQPKPLQRGSQDVSFRDLGRLDEFIKDIDKAKGRTPSDKDSVDSDSYKPSGKS